MTSSICDNYVSVHVNFIFFLFLVWTLNCIRGTFLQKLYEGVDRSDVSYLREYKTGDVEGYAGRVAFRVFVFQQPCLYHQCIAFVFLLG